MGTYQSKYTGAEIDALLDTVNNGGGSGYKETDLISGPVDYALGGTSATTINQNLALLDDISNYDEIVFCVSRKADSVIGHPTEQCIHVSNIVYNNSDTQQWDGSRFTLNTMADQRYSCGLWFKDSKTLRIYNTFATGTVNSTDKFRFISIKGIKY